MRDRSSIAELEAMRFDSGVDGLGLDRPEDQHIAVVVRAEARVRVTETSPTALVHGIS